jgi:cytochrome P450
MSQSPSEAGVGGPVSHPPQGNLLGVDLTDLDNFANGFPHETFARHRQLAPIFWHEPTDKTPDGEGFWSVATYAEAVSIMHDPVTFSSETGGGRPYGGTIIPDLPAAGKMLNMMDDPRHLRIRRLVNRGFTPKMVGSLEEDLRTRTCRIISKVVERTSDGEEGRCDFLVDIAAELPLQVICYLIGAPESDRSNLIEWVEYAFDFRDGDGYGDSEASRNAMMNLVTYGSQLIQEKTRHPGDDMLSTVIHAELPDETPSRLTREELELFFALLFAAGADTTRNAIAGGVLALIENPDQLAIVREDPTTLTTATDEIVRWVSPAAYNRRTATVDVELSGVRIKAGDKVVFWEASANRDEKAFPDAGCFRVKRSPNAHLGFGHGPHHCLGANLARLEIAVTLGEALASFSHLELAAPVEWTRSNKHIGIRHLPLAYRLNPARARVT